PRPTSSTLFPYTTLFRSHVHEVHQEHEHEDGQRQRRDQLAAAMEGLAHQPVDEADDDLDESLELARHASGGAARAEDEGDDEQQIGRDTSELQSRENLVC